MGKSKKCDICGKEFEAHHANVRVCSEECRREKWRIASKKIYNKKVHKGMYSHTCTVCDKEFRSSFRRTKYCSDKCRREGRRRYQMELYHAKNGDVVSGGIAIDEKFLTRGKIHYAGYRN